MDIFSLKKIFIVLQKKYLQNREGMTFSRHKFNEYT